uniref:fructose 1,6-bisphosphatase n=1 Tax=Proteus mirabilis TaxID=584 RepID=UPI0013D2D58E
MRITISVIKADVGSIGGHTMPSARMLDSVRGDVSEAVDQGLIVDGFVCHTGDDICMIMSHRRGKGHPDIHRFAWD